MRSKFPWIESVPEKWETLKVLNCLSMRITDGPHTTPELFDDGVPFVSAEAVSMGKGSINFSHIRGFVSEEFYEECCAKYIPQKDDIYMIKSGATTGKVAIVDTDRVFTIWSPLAVFRCNTSVSIPRFLFYSLQADYFQKQISQNWSFGTQQNIGMRVLEQLRVVMPPLSEQLTIVRFLDIKCSQINSILERTRISIREYKKLKQSVISEAVTKGIQKSRPTKDSGVEWIGSIPSNWKCKKIKHCFSLRDERNYSPMEDVVLLSLYTDIGVFPHGEHEEKGNKAITVDGYKMVHKNDIVVNIILAWMGAIGISEYNGVTSPAYDVWMPRESIYPRYFHYLFRTPGIAAECYKYGRGIMLMRWRTYSDEFKQISIPYPPIEEQQEIVNYLDEKCTVIDSLISSKESLITELESYKNSLIFEYVTGKKRLA